MVKVLLYGYCTGVASSRRIAQRLHEDIAFRVLAANNTPDFRTISDFRKDHLAALAGLFHQVLELCRQAGLVKLGHVALDSTKVRANASRHKAMSYGRMKEREAKAAAEQIGVEGREHPGVPDDKTQRNFTDPDSRIMPGPGGKDFQQSYNCQAVVDHEHQVIVAARATSQPSDKQQIGQAAGRGHDPGDHTEHGRDSQGTVRRRRLLLGPSGGGTGGPGSGPVHRAGEDPPRHEAGAGAPGTDTQETVGPGPDETQAADEAGS